MKRALISVILCIGVSMAAAEFDPSLQGVRFFAYQLQNFDTPEGLQALADSHYDLLVIDQTRSIKGSEDFDSASVVSALHGTAGSSVNRKKVVCYLDAGQAEDFRWYWQDGWGVGNPAWILASDPDWPGDYPVKFWDPAWKALMKQDLAMIVADGYDGAYLDWMEIYSFGPLVQAAQAVGRDPREELISFIRELRDYARSLNPNFFFIAQNAAELGTCREWLDLFSGIGQEDVWFTWGNGQEGDAPQDPELTAVILSDLALWKAAGKIVFDIEYAREPANVSTAYANGKAQGFITYATLKELDQITDTPPTDYRIYNLTHSAWSIGSGPVFSPDGQWLAFSAQDGLWKLRTDGTDFQCILQDSDHAYFIMPGSSWNGILNRICFTSNRGGNSDIWSIAPDGTDLKQLTQSAGRNESATYSPDGKWIVYSSNRSGNWVIHKQDLSTGEAVRLTDYPGDREPNWAPSGNSIAFISFRENGWGDIWTMDPSGLFLRNITKSGGPVGEPAFSPDGRWLIYWVSGDAVFSPLLILRSVTESTQGPYILNYLTKPACSPSFSFDGRYLAFQALFPGSDIWTMPIYLPPPSPHERPMAKPE